MSQVDHLWMLLSGILVFMMQLGFTSLESGLTRSKNNINVAMKNTVDFSISVGIFWLFGFGIAFGTSWSGFLGTDGFVPEFKTEQTETIIFFIFQAMFCGTATTIISGAVSERMSFRAYILIAIVISSLIYPIIAHWVWNGILSDNKLGWLGQKGFYDFAGSTVVHSTGAWVSLALVIILGPRLGRFTKGSKQPMIGSNYPLALLGMLFLWFGWFGFNGGSTLAFNHKVPLILYNTLLAGCFGMIASLAIGWLQFGQVRVENLINGALAGLVSITACCDLVDATQAVIIGCIGATVMNFCSIILEYLKIDDVVNVVPVHGAAGCWGTLCVAIFGDLESIGFTGQRWEMFLVQFQGIVACFVWTFGCSFTIFYLINRISPLRVSRKAEILGLNISEHNAYTTASMLIDHMEKQRKEGDFTSRLDSEPFSEFEEVTHEYNRVLEKIQEKEEETRQSALKEQIAKNETMESNRKLRESVGELQRFNRIAVNREMRILELKREINQLSEKLGQSPVYRISSDEESELKA